MLETSEESLPRDTMMLRFYVLRFTFDMLHFTHYITAVRFTF
jgi:hypothetical protein